MKRITLTLLLCLFLGVFTNAQTGETSIQTSTKTRASSFRPSKSQITAAQIKLKENGNYSGAIDGRYNDDFRASLKAHQEANELEKNGKLDEATIKHLGIPMEKAVSKSAGSPRRTFRATKDQVSGAQTILKGKGLYSGEPSGKYSKGFRDAVKEFQAANGLKRTGSLNRSTLEKLNIDLTDSQMEIPVNPNNLATAKDPTKKTRGPVFRATKDQISEVQRMLKGKSLYAGEETGKLNPETRTAIGEWQTQNSVKKTGTLNKETLEAMKIELTDRQKEF